MEGQGDGEGATSEFGRGRSGVNRKNTLLPVPDGVVGEARRVTHYEAPESGGDPVMSWCGRTFAAADVEQVSEPERESASGARESRCSLHGLHGAGRPSVDGGRRAVEP